MTRELPPGYQILDGYVVAHDGDADDGRWGLYVGDADEGEFLGNLDDYDATVDMAWKHKAKGKAA